MSGKSRPAGRKRGPRRIRTCGAGRDARAPSAFSRRQPMIGMYSRPRAAPRDARRRGSGGHSPVGCDYGPALTLTPALPLALPPKLGEAEAEPPRGGASSHRMMATPSAVPGADGA